jgi:hypothetical protein
MQVDKKNLKVFLSEIFATFYPPPTFCHFTFVIKWLRFCVLAIETYIIEIRPMTAQVARTSSYLYTEKEWGNQHKTDLFTPNQRTGSKITRFFKMNTVALQTCRKKPQNCTS